ncbi:MAG TPA: LD-carboxypeptidase [Streptosporangiaceae bacterium]
MRYPRLVGPGAHVRVISPSWPAMYHVPQRVRRAEKVMRRLGLRVSYGAHSSDITDDGLSAGSVQQRAADFMDAFTDPSVDVVFSAFGGATAHELLSILDVETLRTHDKPFIGNSDNIWLNHFLFQEVGLISYYGITYVGELGGPEGPYPETLDHFRRALMSGDDLVCLPMARRTNEFTNWFVPELERKCRRLNLDGGWVWLRPGQGSGPLLGAELSALIEMTEHFDLTLDGCVLFWDIGLHNTEKAHVLLRELAARTPLDRLSGMVVGPDARYELESWAGVVEEALSSVVPNLQYPVVVNADVGHLDPKWVVPYGHNVIVDSARGVIFPAADRYSEPMR